MSCFLVLMLAGVALYIATDNDFSEGIKMDDEEEQFQLIQQQETQKNTITDSSEEAASVVSNIDINSKSAETVIGEADLEIKSMNVNGKIYQINFKEIENSPDNNNRKARVYRCEGNNTVLKYDYSTNELLSAYFDITEQSKEKITPEKAKSIAEKFIKAQCDASEYSFARISDLSKYWITYYRYIQGYRTTQKITVIVTHSGDIESFSNNKYLFDGIDTDAKIDQKKLDKRLDDYLKQKYGSSIDYFVKNRYISLDSNKKYIMVYTVEISLGDGKERSESYDVQINGDGITGYLSGY